MIYVKKLSASELSVLTKLFRYNDVNAMLIENTNMIENGIGDIFCIFEDDIPFGELRGKYISDDPLYTVKGTRAYLYAFRINKDHRGRGYGKYLLDSVIKILRNDGYTEFTIGVEDKNLRAKHIYECFGFDTVIARKSESYQGDEYFYNLYLKT